MSNFQILTAPVVLSAAGGVLLVAAIVEFIFSVAFCTRPAPAWARQARTLGLGIAGARLLTRDNASIDIDAWFVTGLWLYLAITQAIVAAFTVVAVLPPQSDYCKKERNSKGKMVRTALMIVFAVLMMAGVASAQETPTPGGSSAEDFEVTVGDFAYPLDPADPIQGCVLALSENQDGATITYRLFVREQASEGPIFNSVGIYTDSTDGFPSVEVGDCFGTRVSNG